MTKRSNCTACSFKKHGVKTRKSIPHTCGQDEEIDPLITLYHGTTEVLGKLIKERQCLRPRPDNQYVYLTTDIEVAKQYARAWTGWALTEVATDKRRKVNPTGNIFKIQLRKSLLEDDPYNPEGEPNQYRVLGAIWMDSDPYEVIDVDFSNMATDNSEKLRAYSYWIGIAQANDSM